MHQLKKAVIQHVNEEEFLHLNDKPPPKMRENQKIVEETMIKMGVAPQGIHLSVLLDKCRRKDEKQCVEIVSNYLNEKREKAKSMYMQKLSLKSDKTNIELVQQAIATSLDVSKLREIAEKYKNKEKRERSTMSYLVQNHLGKDIKIKFCGTVGTSGYATASRNYFYSLFISGFQIDFEPVQFHSCSLSNESLQEQVIQACFNHTCKEGEYDIIIIHSIPDLWPHLCNVERKENPQAIIVGITVWESSQIHPKWKEYMKMVDYVVAPCFWNQTVFSRDAGIECLCIHTPLSFQKSSATTDAKPFQLLGELGVEDKIFYTINEWNSRKGIEDLITAFITEFQGSNNVVLYLKCSHIVKDVGESFIQKQRSKVTNPPRIVLDTRVLRDSEIMTIHDKCHVYISLCKSEGTGLGAVEALSRGNPVIITAYGGQLDYLKSGVYYVSFHEETPLMCTTLRAGHENCLPDQKFCKVYPWYLPNQSWGRANLEDARATMRFVYDYYYQCKDQVQLGQTYLEESFSFDFIGKQLHYYFAQMIEK